MKKSSLLITLAAVCLPAGGLQAALVLVPVPVPGPSPTPLTLWNTGVDGGGAKITTGGTADPHWTVTAGILTGVGPPATVLTNQMSGIYIQDPFSAWIYQNAGGTGNGSFTFATTFDLTGFDPSSAVIDGSFAVDNQATLYLNGQSVGIGSGELSYLSSDSGAFNRWHPFHLDSGFQPGMNRLEVVVINDFASKGGLNVNLAGSANTIPEPASAIMGLSGLGLLIMRRRR